ncbi:LOW QUALITY PROTEIN: otogelin [Boleophthalmus pectinirostris]|uniref:LOW QUALITY PROTEIN: otogelin n=1 Tax=Boleophthalmus pectinirostris TaxID=150288 RepID=UPI00242CFC52|nr:LOW QUALITY PROTEIN: otogelin [Boleophthalmus pectinirostris]
MEPRAGLTRTDTARALLLGLVLVYQACLSWGAERVNLQQEINNGSLGTKAEKWDTTALGDQSLHGTRGQNATRDVLSKWRQSETENANQTLHHDSWDQSGGFEEEEEGGTNSTVLRRQFKEALNTNSRRRSPGPCRFACLNGGQCVNSESCDCSLYQATGHRCQTVPNQGFEREMTCRSWGQYNFETFDGLYFHFPGRCTYTLLRDCEEGPGVTVQVHNDPDCGSSYSCRRSVSLFMNWDGEIRLNAHNVTFKGERLELPHHIHDLMLEQISDYVLATQHGFTLAWDGLRGSVYIKLSPEYVSRTCGLCGNFNADAQDDLRTSYGVPTEEIEMFGNSWQEVEPDESRCPIVSPGFTSPCSGVPDHVLQAIHEVCSLLLEPPFSDCHEFVSPLSYMASCTNDLCLSGPVDEMLCLVLSEYARACAHADHPLHHWRQTFPLCERPCASGLQWRECISCCPQTCRQEKNCIDSRLACVDGCYCPEGLVLESGSCVLPSECPCEHHGLMYPSGHTLDDRCNSCTCVGGVWNCTDYTCPAECSVTGDMFFQSFDGRVFSFASTCQYVLSKSHNSGRFTVTIQNAPCGANLDGSCLQSVSLVVDEDPRTELTLSHVGEVFLGGQYRISLPYSDEVLEVQELSSMFVQVQTVFGLRIQFSWSESRLYLQLDQRWLQDTVGLCGTFNGNSQDDFLSPSGMIESTPQLFGNSWRVSSACAVSLSAPQIDPCDAHQQAVSYASEKCSVLTQELFASCHEHVSPGPFLLQCRSDACKCGAPCFCSSLAHYARHCRQHGVLVHFRAHIPECEATCPYSMVYGPCVSSCLRRCSTLSLPHVCSAECEEGCVCPEETYYNHRTRTCVQRSECPCSFLGADYEPGDMIMTSAGVQLCVDGKLVSQSPASDGLCPVGQIYLNCSDAGVMSQRGVACERTCESYLLNLTCSSHEPCVSGCICPPGLLKHGDECFEPQACPCLWKGKEYFPGDRVSSPCHHCVCQHGTFQCVFRPCASMCSAYGDRHYRTFDGLLYDYVGVCRVHLLKSRVDTPVSVLVENVDCFNSGVICRKSLLISVGQTLIAFDDASGKPNPSSVIDRRQRVFLFSAGIFSVVHFHEEDLTVLWDRKTTVHIQAGPRWQGKLSGLCGNFDLKTVNEMRTPENIESPTPQEFGNSWTATECLSSPDVRPPCSVFPLREPFAKRQCSVLLSEVFQSCHPVVDVTWFYMNCVADTCSCSRGGDCECFCSSVAAYAQRCCLQGVSVDWRSPSLCPYDCEYYNKVLGKGPYRLIPFRDRTSVLASSRSPGSVFLVRANSSESQGFLSKFMMTPGLSRSRPHDTSRVSFEAADRPNYFLFASPSGEVKLSKWRDSDAFWEGATFVLHRDTWIPGFVSLESQSKPGFFLHATRLIHLLKYRHTDSYRKATLFRVTGPSADAPVGPQCQWRYDSCSVPCFKTCSDPRADSCTSIPQVESCLPVCPSHMVLDEVTHRCVHLQDCINPPVGSDTSFLTFPSLNTTLSGVSPPEVQPEHYTSRVTDSPSSRTTTGAPYAITALFWFTDIMSTTALTKPEPTKSAEITTKTTTITTKPADLQAVQGYRETIENDDEIERYEHKTDKTHGKTDEINHQIDHDFDRVPHRTSRTHKICHGGDGDHARSGESDDESGGDEHAAERDHEGRERNQHEARVESTSKMSTLSVTTTSATATTTTTTTAATTTSTTTRTSDPWHSPHGTTTVQVSPATKSSHNYRARIYSQNDTHKRNYSPSKDRNVREASDRENGDGPDHFCREGAPCCGNERSAAGDTKTHSDNNNNNNSNDSGSSSGHRQSGAPTSGQKLETTSYATTTTSTVKSDDKTTTKKAEIAKTPTPSFKPPTEATEAWSVRASTAASTVSVTTETSKVTTKERGEDEEEAPTTTAKTTPKATPSTVLDTTKYTETTAAVSLQTARACTPPYAEIVDECTKFICVNHQLILFNKSQSCSFTSEPPNCGLLGFAVLVNGDKCCPQWECPCRCSLFPDLSVITYDGNSVAVFKAASYIITQLETETLSVSVQECPADSRSPLLWNFTHLCLVALNITHKSNHIVIDRLQRRLYVNSRYAKPRFKKFGFEIYDTGNMYLIKTPAGLRLQWFHSTGMMVVDTEAHYNRLTTRGLCGFCDGDPSNDLTLPSGSFVSDSEQFIESWTVPNTTSSISPTRRRNANCTTSDCSQCLSMIQGHDYRPCHPHVPPSTFCELWVRDTEYVNNHCVALSAYAASCHKFNICIEWRKQDHCPFLCPDGLQYQSCLPACSASSCPNQDFDSDPDQCSGLTEGCVCPEGTLLHRPYSKLCVQPDKCACTDSAGLPRAHGEVWKSSHDACCMYRCENDTIVPVEFNCSTAAPQCHRQGEVVISLADQDTCCPHKLCVCNQSLCELPPPLCNYGEKLVSYYRQDSCCPQYSCECDPELCESVVPSCRDDQTLISTRTDGSCCLAHICMCASCSEAPPVCQEGEVLTVDFNTTDRCCPPYVCVCEPERCPEISCSVGMSPVSSSVPGRCCPKQTCECACEKIISPKCGLGETTQLDRAFMSDPQNQCDCKRYKCVPEPGCIFPERGLLLLPGQMLVEHSDGGVCFSRQCSRSVDSSSGLNIMRTTTHNCSTSCLPNQIYVPPKDQSSCCGFCKNISCSYEHENGTVAFYKPGRSWMSNCTKYDCADTESGTTLISLPISCPPFNAFECLQNGGHVVSYMDGCCKTCNLLALLPFPVSPVSPTVSSNCERGKEDGKSCQKVTVRMTIRKNNCRSNRPVNVVSCDGKCPSASIYNYNINTYARFCKCCRETGLQRRTVQLYCSNNSTWVNYDIQEPTDCSCLWS